MTVSTSIMVADKLAPNSLDEAVKRRWLGDLEGMVRVELWGQTTEQVREVTEDGVMTATGSLEIPYPFDRMYWMYLVAMIEQVHGDATRYAHAAAMFNAVYTSYAKWLKRGGV